MAELDFQSRLLNLKILSLYKTITTKEGASVYCPIVLKEQKMSRAHLPSLITFHVSFTVMGAGEVGLSLSYAILLTSNFQWCVRQSAEVENQVEIGLLVVLLKVTV